MYEYYIILCINTMYKNHVKTLCINTMKQYYVQIQCRNTENKYCSTVGYLWV